MPVVASAPCGTLAAATMSGRTRRRPARRSSSAVRDADRRNLQGCGYDCGWIRITREEEVQSSCCIMRAVPVSVHLFLGTTVFSVARKRRVAPRAVVMKTGAS